MNKKIYIFCGARPNFIKISSLYNVLKKYLKIEIIHLGQHQDFIMSDIFFKNLNIPKPYIKFSLKKKTSLTRTSEMIEKLDNFLKKEKKKISLGIVVGDVDATFVASVCLNRHKIKFAHIEAGLRSKNKYMPEEANRIVADHLSDFLFTTTLNAKKNLINEGINKKNIFFVGNTMIDTLYSNLNNFSKSKILNNLKIKDNKFILLTIHRKENTEDLLKLDNFIKKISKIFYDKKILFVLHPRVLKSRYNLKIINNLIYSKPLNYFEFISLIKKSFLVMTDSGGVSEETSMLGKICLTLRDRTERPETVKYGTNIIVNFNTNKIAKIYSQMKKNRVKKSKIKLWDGKSSKRIAKIIMKKI